MKETNHTFVIYFKWIKFDNFQFIYNYGFNTKFSWILKQLRFDNYHDNYQTILSENYWNENIFIWSFSPRKFIFVKSVSDCDYQSAEPIFQSLVHFVTEDAFCHVQLGHHNAFILFLCHVPTDQGSFLIGKPSMVR